MKNYIVETMPGDNFYKVAKKALELSIEIGRTAEFDFNGIICIVDENTNFTNLNKYYGDAFIMDWKIIGPICNDSYPQDVEEELQKRRKLQQENDDKQQEKYRKETDQKNARIEKLTTGLSIELKDEVLWIDQKTVNSDCYGKAIMDYAERWALLMQLEIANGKEIKDIAGKTSHEADTDGLTGSMYGAAVMELSSCWKYGEELRKWHNKEYDHEGEGIVNPAILTIK